jgi:hypothetical protein
LWLAKEGLSVLWKLEAMMEEFCKKMAALELHASANPEYVGRRPRTRSNATGAFAAALFLSKVKQRLAKYRKAKKAKIKPASNPGVRRIKPVVRVNSGFMPNQRRKTLLEEHAKKAVKAAAHPKSNPEPKGPRAPSPDFYLIGAVGSVPSTPPPPYPGPPSSSPKRIPTQYKTRTAVPKAVPKTTPEALCPRLECWKVGVAHLCIGFKSAPQFLRYKRGQTQLRKMAGMIKDSDSYARHALNEKDIRVKMIMNMRNRKEKKDNTGRKCTFLAGKILSRDPGRTGTMVVEKAVVILSIR